MTDWLALAAKQQASLFGLLEELVTIESPTSCKAGNDRAGQLLTGCARALGASVEIHRQSEFGDHIVAGWPGKGKHGLLIGHMDTVWPLGTLGRMGYTVRGGHIYGPGVLDMKGGLAATLRALALVQEAGKWPTRPLRLIFNSDEERGSPTSRSVVETQARGAAYVVVTEPGHGPKGVIRTRRKGVGEFRVRVAGKAAHAGLAPHRGVSAVVEIAHQIVKMQSLADPSA